MKKPRSSRSAYTNFRVFLAFTLCLAGFSLAVTAFGAWPDLTAALRIGSQNQSGYEAKLKAKTNRSGGASKSMTRSTSGAAPANNPTAQTQPGYAAQNTVTQQTNALGQTVYTISPSNFDISPPLAELAKISLPHPVQQQLPELPLPPERILRSDKPDPVTQVAPPSSVRAPLAPDSAATGFNFEGVAGAVTGGYPPDTNGSVGNDQYVEIVNTSYQVWSLNRTTKVATSVLGPVSINTLWAGFGGACQSQNAGDPVVLYDKVANRWLISQFTSAASAGHFYQCVAVSETKQCRRSVFPLRICRWFPQYRPTLQKSVISLTASLVPENVNHIFQPRRTQC